MPDNELRAMGDTDVSAKTESAQTAPLKGATTQGQGGDAQSGALTETTTDAKTAIKDSVGGYGAQAADSVGGYGAQAADKARMFAEDGKAKAGGALDQIAQLLTDAAEQVDDKLGAQYGGYARNAAQTITGFSDQVKAKDIDELVDDARELVRKSPGIAIGAAAAVGFVVARLIQSGLESGTSDPKSGA